MNDDRLDLADRALRLARALEDTLADVERRLAEGQHPQRILNAIAGERRRIAEESHRG